MKSSWATHILLETCCILEEECVFPITTKATIGNRGNYLSFPTHSCHGFALYQFPLNLQNVVFHPSISLTVTFLNANTNNGLSCQKSIYNSLSSWCVNFNINIFADTDDLFHFNHHSLHLIWKNLWSCLKEKIKTKENKTGLNFMLVLCIFSCFTFFNCFFYFYNLLHFCVLLVIFSDIYM